VLRRTLCLEAAYEATLAEGRVRTEGLEEAACDGRGAKSRDRMVFGNGVLSPVPDLPQIRQSPQVA
jgi:hypothetical protein